MPNFHKKIIGIEGNITCSNLGIKDDDLKDITNTVSAIYFLVITLDVLSVIFRCQWFITQLLQ